MLPEVDKCKLQNLRVELNMPKSMVMDILVSVSQYEKSKSVSLPSLLREHSRCTFNDEDFELKVNRSCIWNKAKMYYRRIMNNSDHDLLQKKLDSVRKR